MSADEPAEKISRTGRRFTKAEIEAQERRKASTRASIMAAATDAFLERGFLASLDEIAQRAGVSRRTLFNIFKNKDDLLSHVVDEIFEIAFRDIEKVPDDLSLFDTLLIYGRSWRRVVLSREAIALTRLGATEAGRKVGQLSHDAGRLRSVDILAKNLQRRMERGEIVQIDPADAAERFLAAAVGHARSKRLFDLPVSGEDQMERFLIETAEIFSKGMSARP